MDRQFRIDLIDVFTQTLDYLESFGDWNDTENGIMVDIIWALQELDKYETDNG